MITTKGKFLRYLIPIRMLEEKAMVSGLILVAVTECVIYAGSGSYSYIFLPPVRFLFI